MELKKNADATRSRKGKHVIDKLKRVVTVKITEEDNKRYTFAV